MIQEAFLRDVIAHPDDDAPRLIYADWLDENGDPDRAEFIRLQIDRARACGHAPSQRERQLLVENEPRWTGPLHGIVQRARFARGFVEQVFVLAENFLRHGEALFQLAPVRHVVFTKVRPDWRPLMASSHLRHVSTFELRGCGMSADEARLLAKCPHLPNLRQLFLRYGVDGEAIHVLAGSPSLARLRALDLYGCGLESEGAAGLVQSPHLDGLSYLALGDFASENVDIVAELTGPSARLPGLTELYLGWTNIDDEGASRLASAPKFARLQALDLMDNDIGRMGAKALASSPHLQALQALYLQGNPLDGGSRKALRARFGDRVWLDG
jgi:uncharacterized protein (TIGR02996 family)